MTVPVFDAIVLICPAPVPLVMWIWLFVHWFYLLLVTSSYAPNKDSHTKRSDVSNEVSGTGYTAGGAATTATVTKNTVADQVTIAFSAIAWSTATITAAGGVIYKRRGGASSADELVAYLDFGGDVSSTAGTFTVTPSSPITFQN